jgi:hypothetical protein
VSFSIVNRFFKCDQSLCDYVQAIDLSQWSPSFVVLHNTSIPSIAQRPNGFTSQHMINFCQYYSGMDWHAGPHAFVDQNGVWIFSPLSAPGVHSPSFNRISWGIEQLGEFDNEPYDSGPGAAIRDNAVFLMAALHVKAGLDSHTLRFHKEDPKTTHKDCPGRNCQKEDVIQRVHDRILEMTR